MRLQMERSGSNSGRVGMQQQQQQQQQTAATTSTMSTSPPQQQAQQSSTAMEGGDGQQQQQQQQQQAQPNGSPTSPGVQHTTNGRGYGGGGRPGTSSQPSSSGTPTSSSMSPHSSSYRYSPSSSMPLRIFVSKDLVGAIIGRGGGTIRQITQETRARVDVHRKDNSNPNENVIGIYGSPENCSQACRRLLEVMQQEARALNRPDEINLKMLASNNHIGRIIGKGGATIKRIMQQTDTRIAVSNANIPSSINAPPERMITIVGTLDSMCHAEALISQKLRQCVENDVLQYQQAIAMYGAAVTAAGGGLPPPPISPGAGPSGYGAPSAQAGQGGGGAYGGGAPPPNGSGGGGGGGHRSSSASGGPSSTSGGGAPQSSASMHHIAGASMPSYSPYSMPYLVGPYGGGAGGAMPMGTMPAGNIAPYWAMPQAAAPAHHQYPASPYYAAAPPYMPGPLLGSHPGESMFRETVSIFVPNSVVGAIIGRSGMTIREMMSNSGATIKVTQMSEEDAAIVAASTSASGTTSAPTADSPDSSSSGGGAGGSGSSPANRTIERRVTVIGTPSSQSLAQYYIHNKVMQELAHQQQQGSMGPGSYNELPVLKTEMTVPTAHVRRIIGKSGSVIQELQRSSGSIIKMSREPQATVSSNGGSVVVGGEERATSSSSSSTTTTPSPSTSAQPDADSFTSVMIIGDYYASISAQRQISMIVQKAYMSAAAAAASGAAASSSSSSSSPINRPRPSAGESSQATPEEVVVEASAEPPTEEAAEAEAAAVGDRAGGDEVIDALAEQVKSAANIEDS